MSGVLVLHGFVARDGGECLPTRHLPDDYTTIRDAIRNTDADVILVSGGTSVGVEDYTPRAIAELTDASDGCSVAASVCILAVNTP